MRRDIFPAGSYFALLHQILSAVEITDEQGRRLPADSGAARAVNAVLDARDHKGVVALVGNGGSAAICAHMHNDLCASVGVRAVIFNDPPLLTALSNDHGYVNAFEMQMRMWAPLGGMLVAISSSGRSENILRAARTAREHGLKLLTMTGFDPDNPLRSLGLLNFYIPSHSYGYVELAHSCLAHYVTDAAMLTLARGDEDIRVDGEVDAPSRM